MAVRTDLTIDWSLSPRLITVASPSVEITIQDLVDTLREAEHDHENLGFGRLIDAAGKEPLGGGVQVGITATLQNSVLAFEARLGPTWILCTISGGNLVASDVNGDPIDPRFPTAFTTIDRASSSSATLLNQESLEASSLLVLKILQNKTITDPDTGIMTVYDDDGTTVLFTANLYEGKTTSQPYRGQGAERRERLV